MDDQTIKVEAVHFDVAADEVAAGGHEVKSETQVEQVFVDCGFENGEEEGADFNESQVGTSRNATCVVYQRTHPRGHRVLLVIFRVPH